MKTKLKKRTRIRLAWEAFVSIPVVSFLIVFGIFILVGVMYES